MKRRTIHFLLLLALIIPAACTSAAARAASGSGNNPYLIGAWELEEIPEYSALDGIRRLRPNWFRPNREPRIHLDGAPLQGTQELENLRCADINQMQFITGPDATTRWGTGYSNGVILIISGD